MFMLSKNNFIVILFVFRKLPGTAYEALLYNYVKHLDFGGEVVSLFV
ncbi:MAG: hypothetical protein J6R02_05845 [Alistipes sp.]|nr:hypothetical protein [Alistipes sp.]